MKNLRSLVSGWVLSTGVSTEGSSEQSQGVSEASPHWTEASPVSITAPKATGSWMQRLWVTVNVQEVLLPGHCGPVWMTGSPQQIGSGGSGMCKRGDRYRNANGFFLVKRRFTGFCGTARKVRIWSGRKLSDRRRKDRD